VHVEAEDLAIAHAEGLVIVTNPGSNMRLFNGAPPLSGFFESGCVVALGTDNCALSDDEDYLRELRFGAILAREPGIAAHGPSPADMLETATRSGVRASFLPEECGTLHPGAPVDLVALDLARISGGSTLSKTALLDAILARGHGADVNLTMVAGESRYRANAEDSARLEHWRESAMRSVATRNVFHEEASIIAFQAAIREVNATPDTPSLLLRENHS
jgi:cytosine/adenosine deaminase-related metal-dependent hydrolase